MRYIPVRLTRKLANFINGLDLTHCAVGDIVEVPGHSALMLFGEGWAEPIDCDLLRARDLSKPRAGSDVDAA